MARRTQMNMCLDILSVLLQNRKPMKLTHIMYKANINCSKLKNQLEWLVSKGLITEEKVDKRKTRLEYSITDAGIKLLNQALNVTAVFNDLEPNSCVGW